MQLMRFVRISVPFVVLGLVGFVLGCSGGQPASTPRTKEESKKIADEMKASQQQAAKDRMMNRMKRRGPR